MAQRPFEPIELPEPLRQENPEAFAAAMLSEASYVGKSKAFGWHSIPDGMKVDEEQQEKFRQKLASGERISPAEAKTLRSGFWHDDLQMLLNAEIESGVESRAGRDALARRLWVALYTKPDHPEGLSSETIKAAVKSDISSKQILTNGAGFSREGVFRADDVHCMMFAKVWDPKERFGPANTTTWMVARGTENNARALSTPPLVFLKDYVAKAYRNFAKSFALHYRDSVEGYLNAKQGLAAAPNGELPEGALKSQVGRVILTGHSLGGSVATEAAIQLSDRFQKEGIDVKGYTFGSPGVGKVGPLSAVGAGAVLVGALGLHALAWAAQKANPFHISKDRMASQSSGFSEVGRQARIAIGGLWSSITNLPLIGMVDTLAQTATNVIDACGHKARGMLKFGWQGFRTEGAEAWAGAPGRLTHYAHRRDFIPIVGECMGFSPMGEKVSMDSGKSVDFSPFKEHDSGGYVSSVQDLMARQNQTSHPWVQAMGGCRDAVDQMMLRQAWLHRMALRSQMELPFVRSQMLVGFSFDPHEAPAWARTMVAEEERRELREQLRPGNDFVGPPERVQLQLAPLEKESHYIYGNLLVSESAGGGLQASGSVAQKAKMAMQLANRYAEAHTPGIAHFSVASASLDKMPEWMVNVRVKDPEVRKHASARPLREELNSIASALPNPIHLQVGVAELDFNLARQRKIRALSSDPSQLAAVKEAQEVAPGLANTSPKARKP